MHKSITLLGREFHFGLGFLNELINGTGVSVDDFDDEVKKNPAKFMPLMIYHSLSYSYFRNKKEVDFDIHDIYDLIDDNGGLGGDFATSFFLSFMKSMTKDVPVDDSKKKARKEK